MFTNTQISTILFAFAILVPTTTSALTWYIKADGTGDAPTIQDAIVASSDGDTVLLAAGVYTGPGNYDIDFFKKAILLTSQSGAAVTIIDCQNNGRGFLFTKKETPSSILEGVTITNAWTNANGGGVFCKVADPTIRNNIIVGNHSGGDGGGIYTRQGNPIIENNTITNNSASGQGGGIAVGQQSAPQISYNIITFSTSGTGVACPGPGASPILTCNNIYGNAGGDGLCGIDGGNNISSDPQFCGTPGNGNFSLQSDSPCAPGFSLCGVLLGALPVRCGSVSTHKKTWGDIKAMFRQ